MEQSGDDYAESGGNAKFLPCPHTWQLKVKLTTLTGLQFSCLDFSGYDRHEKYIKLTFETLKQLCGETEQKLTAGFNHVKADATGECMLSKPTPLSHPLSLLLSHTVAAATHTHTHRPTS